MEDKTTHKRITIEFVLHFHTLFVLPFRFKMYKDCIPCTPTSGPLGSYKKVKISAYCTSLHVSPRAAVLSSQKNNALYQMYIIVSAPHNVQ